MLLMFSSITREETSRIVYLIKGGKQFYIPLSPSYIPYETCYYILTNPKAHILRYKPINIKGKSGKVKDKG